MSSTTITPAAAGISVGGQIVTAAAADDLHVNSTEISAGPIGAILSVIQLPAE